MDTLLRFIRMLLALSLAITLIQLAQDRGGGDMFFTLLGLVLALNVAPYLGSIAAMKRLPVRWGLAVGVAACLFGLADVGIRMQAFNFPTETSDGRMALWLPIYAVAAIPLLALICYAGIAVFSRTGRPTNGAESRRP
jgi:hypothetical protein